MPYPHPQLLVPPAEPWSDEGEDSDDPWWLLPAIAVCSLPWLLAAVWLLWP